VSDPRPPLRLLELGDPIRRDDTSGSEVAPVEETTRPTWTWDDNDSAPFSSGLRLGAGVAAAIALGIGLAVLAAAGAVSFFGR
jgi:hypothetical protein